MFLFPQGWAEQTGTGGKDWHPWQQSHGNAPTGATHCSVPGMLKPSGHRMSEPSPIPAAPAQLPSLGPRALHTQHGAVSDPTTNSCHWKGCSFFLAGIGRKAQSHGSAQLSKLHWEFVIPSYSSGSINSPTRSGADTKDSVKHITEGRLLEAPLNCYTFLVPSSSSRDPKTLPRTFSTLLKARAPCSQEGHAERSHIPNPNSYSKAISGKYLHSKSPYDPTDENQDTNPFQPVEHTIPMGTSLLLK